MVDLLEKDMGKTSAAEIEDESYNSSNDYLNQTGDDYQ